MGTKVKKRISNSVSIAISSVICVVHLIPFYILIVAAFKMPRDLSSRWALPSYLYFENFVTAVEYGNILKNVLCNIIIAAGSISGIVVLGAIASYPLARNASRLNKMVLTFIMGMLMIPPLSIIVPLYGLFSSLKATSTYWGIISVITTFQLPTSIFLYTNFIKSIPITLDEAAEIDGCSPLRTFFSIVLPQLKPVTASVIIMTGVSCWNDYTFSLYLLQSPKIKTVTLAIASFFTQFTANLGAAAAGALIGIMPILILYLSLQKYFVKGMVDSAIK